MLILKIIKDNNLKEILLITVATKLILILPILLVHPLSLNIFYLWNRWDSSWYLNIAQNWYEPFGKQSLSIVFFPLYPILIKIGAFIIGDFQISAVLVSVFFSVVASVFLYKLTLLDFDRKTAIKAVWFLNIFPTAYFLQAAYTESLFLSTSITTIYLFRKNLFLSSGFAGILTCLARINGILLLPIFIMEKNISKKSLVPLLLTPLGFIIYLGINYSIFNDPFYFTKVLSSNWFKKPDWPWNGINNLIQSTPSITDANFYIYLSELITIPILLFLGIYTYLRVRKSYGIYILLNLLLITSTSFILSTPRYALSIFPIFIALGTIKNKTLLTSLSLSFILLLFIFNHLYIGGRWAF